MGIHGGQLGFLVGTILATFDLQVTPMLPTKFKVIYLASRFRSRSEKIDFQDGSYGGHFEFLIGTILATFDLQVTPMLPTKFKVI